LKKNGLILLIKSEVDMNHASCDLVLSTRSHKHSWIVLADNGRELFAND